MSDGEQTENKTQHLHILMAPSEVEAIDDWGFKNRIRTRAEAIRRLCQIGLAFEAELPDLYEKAHQAFHIDFDLDEKANKAREVGDHETLANINDHLFTEFLRMTGDIWMSLAALRQVSTAMVSQENFENAIKDAKYRLENLEEVIRKEYRSKE